MVAGSASFLSTLPARGATHGPERRNLLGRISIHAPREGSDQERERQQQRSHISIHAPREGSDGSNLSIQLTDAQFLSTLPARGATQDAVRHAVHLVGFLSTLPARGATEGSFRGLAVEDISIHAPREGSD